MTHQPLEVIDFPEPYTDLHKADMISAYTQALIHNELPAFQVDVGHDYAVIGTLAVQKIIEQSVEEVHSTVHDSTTLPFRFSAQNLRAPFYVRPQHALSTPYPPHIDQRQLGPAMHKEYVGKPTRVQFGYIAEGVTLPPAEPGYSGPGLEAFSDTVYEGITFLGRLSVFSQGNRAWGMQPTAHYFEREASQNVGGRYTRFSMFDPDRSPYPADPDNYELFVQMRKNASVHLDWCQWQLLSEELHAQQAIMPPERHQEIMQLAEPHLHDHPGKQYSYWQVTGPDGFSYGVIPHSGNAITSIYPVV